MHKSIFYTFAAIVGYVTAQIQPATDINIPNDNVHVERRATTRQAYVRIQNDSPNPIYGVQVLHKHSSKFRHKNLWNMVEPNQYTGDTLKVYYDTGFGTGADWWVVSWYAHDKKKAYITSPQNGRWIFDKLEKVGDTVAGALTGLGKIGDDLLQSEATAGFKKCTLTKDDRDGLVTIHINQDNTIRIQPAKSSGCDTGTKQLSVSSTASGPPRPFYAIAHRVLSYKAALAAVQDGANALEIDVRAWKDDAFRATHDRLSDTFRGKGPTVEELFRDIAKGGLGEKISFIWLDLKNPNDYDTAPLNIETLRQLARDHLEKVGIKVLYGFYSVDDTKTRAYGVIRDGLNENEAIGVEGAAKKVAQAFEEHGPSNKRQRVMTDGFFDPSLKPSISQNLREAVESKAFGQVFGWTIADVNTKQAIDLMTGGVDGLIYGPVSSEYTSASLGVFKTLTEWLDPNTNGRYLAKSTDKPW